MIDIKSAINSLENHEILSHKTPEAILSITGPDALEFINRMSTNLVSNNIPIATCFINNKGRMVDYVRVFPDQDKFFLLSSHKDPHILLNWLNKFHFIEELVINIESEISGFYLFSKNISGPLLAKSPFSLPQAEIFITLATKPQGINIGADIFDTLRIASMMPMAPNEINEQWMPQNINLLGSIAQKGCYIGQEVILKALTYQKNVKNLLGAKLSLRDWQNLDPKALSSKAPVYLEGFINALFIKNV
jgi:folate-binding protein YgfZ